MSPLIIFVCFDMNILSSSSSGLFGELYAAFSCFSVLFAIVTSTTALSSFVVWYFKLFCWFEPGFVD